MTPRVSTSALVASMGERRAFRSRGPLAIHEAALAQDYSQTAGDPKPIARGPVAVVEVVGPLMHHPDCWFDSYDAIKERVRCALETNAASVLLSIDSPGGLVAGCFDTVREIRTMAERSGKAVYAYVDATSFSGGYALACAGSKIYIPPSGIAGSIGVISELVDVTEQDSQVGERHTIVKSGDRKADGNPHTATTPENVAAEQVVVDDLAGQFFQLVADCRGMSIAEAAGLQAGVLVGEKAVAGKLADEIATFDQVITILSGDISEPTVIAREASPVDAPPAQAAMVGNFDEDKHPRKDDGEFGEGSGDKDEGKAEEPHKFDRDAALSVFGGKPGGSIGGESQSGTQHGGDPSKSGNPENPDSFTIRWANGCVDTISDRDGEKDTYHLELPKELAESDAYDRVYTMAQDIAAAYDKANGLTHDGSDKLDRSSFIDIKDGRTFIISLVRPPDKEEGKEKKYPLGSFTENKPKTKSSAAKSAAKVVTKSPTDATAAKATASSMRPEMGRKSHMSALRKMLLDEAAEDSDAGRKAKKALQAYDEEEPKDGEEEPAPKPAEGAAAAAPAPAAEGSDETGEDPADKEPDGDEKGANASRTNMTLAAKVQELATWKAEQEEKTERSKLMASRPDFVLETVNFLNKQPIATVRDACRPAGKGGLPVGPGKGGQVGAARAALGATATIPAGANMNEPDVINDEESTEMARRMGLPTAKSPVTRDGTRVALGVVTREQAVAWNEKRAAAATNGAK